MTELSKRCRNGWSDFNFWFSIDSLTEGFKVKFCCFFSLFHHSTKNSIIMTQWRKRYRNCWVNFWENNVTARFLWIFFFPINLLSVQQSSKSYSITLPRMERCYFCLDLLVLRNGATCKKNRKKLLWAKSKKFLYLWKDETQTLKSMFFGLVS